MSKPDLSSRHFQRKISAFCELRIAPITTKRATEGINSYLINLIVHRGSPALVNGRIDWTEISHACGIDGEFSDDLKKQVRIALDAILRWLGAAPAAEDLRPTRNTPRPGEPNRRQASAKAASSRKPQPIGGDDPRETQSTSTRRGPAPKPIHPFPDPLFEASEDPTGFQDALVYHMRRFGESYWQLCRAVVRLGETFDPKTLCRAK